MAEYDDYVWRLHSASPLYEVVLPKDLEWVDEFTWKSVSHDIKNTLTGGIVIHEYKKQYGRPITFVGADDMAWVQRPIVEKLYNMVNEESIVMTLDFVKASYNQSLDTWTFDVLNILQSHNVMFDLSGDALSVESVKRFDNFEINSWFKIRSLAFLEVTGDPLNPCT